jgi:hypothetical protein
MRGNCTNSNSSSNNSNNNNGIAKIRMSGTKILEAMIAVDCYDSVRHSSVKPTILQMIL